MIQTIEGRIGGGKTYTAMGWICNHLVRGGVVASNINIIKEPFIDQYGKKKGLRAVLKDEFKYELQDEQLIYLSDTELVPYDTGKQVVQLNSIVMFYKLVPRGTPKKTVLVVIDEAHIHFPQDGYRSIPKEVLHFLTLSRHASVDVVFISQHIKNMWCQMLRLAQFRWSIRDMKKYGLPMGLFNLPWPWPHFLQIKFDYDGLTPMSRKFEWHRKYLYETYKSPELASSFESMPVAASVFVKKKGMTMKEKILVFTYGFAACFVFLFVPACVSDPSSELVESPPFITNSAPVSAVSVAPPSLPPDPVIEEPVERPTAFFGGFVNSKLWTLCGAEKRCYEEGKYFDDRLVKRVTENSVTFETSDGKIETLCF